MMVRSDPQSPVSSFASRQGELKKCPHAKALRPLGEDFWKQGRPAFKKACVIPDGILCFFGRRPCQLSASLAPLREKSSFASRQGELKKCPHAKAQRPLREDSWKPALSLTGYCVFLAEGHVMLSASLAPLREKNSFSSRREALKKLSHAKALRPLREEHFLKAGKTCFQKGFFSAYPAPLREPISLPLREKC